MKKLKCDFCGKETTEKYELDGNVMCTECRDGHTVVCSRCGKRIWNDDNYGDDHIDLCSDCYGEHYTRCDRYNAIITYDAALYYDDEDIPYCDDCYDAVANERIIHGYNYKPYPIFYGDSKMHLGVELEIDDGGEDSNNAQKIMNVANAQHDHLYCKHDGSIDNGFELVTHPMDLLYHRTVMPWKSILDTAVNLGYRSHQTSTCGLHIHVSRCALGSTYTEQEETIARIVYFIEMMWEQLLKFSRRTEANINRWASRYGLADNAKETYDKAKKGNGQGRYVCLNLYNNETIEFRIFRGTLRYETLIATLELVHEICKQAIEKTDKDFEQMCWEDFVKEINPISKPELISYLKSKQLYERGDM